MKGATIAASVAVLAAAVLGSPNVAAEDAAPAASPVARGDGAASVEPGGGAAGSALTTIGLGVGLGVSQLFEVDSVNRRLVGAGFAELPEVGPHVSLSFPLSIDRFVILPQLRMVHLGGPNDSSQLDAYLGTLAFGYSLTPPGWLALYPFAGVGVGAAELTAGGPGLAAGSFDDALAQQSGGLDMSTLSFIGTVGIGADLQIARAQEHPTRGLFIGARTGFTAGFVHTDWSLGPAEGDLADGPSAPASGFYGELAFGVRF